MEKEEKTYEDGVVDGMTVEHDRLKALVSPLDTVWGIVRLFDFGIEVDEGREYDTETNEWVSKKEFKKRHGTIL
jgi:hypothetical protein